MSVRINPFERLGEDVSRQATARDAFAEAKLLNWNVRVADMFALDPAPRSNSMLLTGLPFVRAPRLRATIFDSPFSGQTEFISLVGMRYTAIQNEYLMELTDTVLGQTRAALLSAGWLEYDKLVVVSMDLKKPRMVGGIDPINFFIYGVTSHDGHFTFRFSLLPVRFACWNTMPINIPTLGFHYRAKHTSNATARIDELKEYLGSVDGLINNFMDTANGLFSNEMRDEDFHETTIRLIKASLPKKRKKADQIEGPPAADLFGIIAPVDSDEPDFDVEHEWRRCKRIYESDQMASIRGTAWGGLQSFLEWLQYHCPISARGLDEDYVRASRAVFADQGYTEIVSNAFNAFGELGPST
jgi:hypothetical protein